MSRSESSCLRAAEFAVRVLSRFMLWLPVPTRVLEKKLKFGVRWLAALWLLATISPAAAQGDLSIYTDSIQNSWDNWSWNTTLDFAYGGTYIHSGAKAIGVTITAGGGALSLHHSDIDASAYTSLAFWINGGASGGQQLQVYAELGGTAQSPVNLPTLTANTWQQITLSLASLRVAGQPNFARFSIQNKTGSALATFYVDDMSL